MSLRVTFSNSITFTVMNQYGKGCVVQIESVLTNSLKIWNVTKSDFFQMNYLHNDQWI